MSDNKDLKSKILLMRQKNFGEIVNEANEKNGCLEIVANKHKIGLLGNNKSAIPTKVCRKLKWKKIITKPGDAIFFDSYTPHRSKKNNTKKSRNIIYLTYNLLSDGDLRKKYFVKTTK